MDLSADLRAAQDTFDQADRELVDARNRLDTATAAYDRIRRATPVGAPVTGARAAWGLAGLECWNALIARETAKDDLAAARRTTDRDAADALLLPTRRPR
ncbi:hypothetical protein DQ384_26120 [Sphaerisporangium album]|uniref:Uncharacterized protein n=1 Tax=Sphaerisporangium album TaxID=509200 RepID=A0A367FA07_9ACTN|nr:hypothetical protein [Sphaerisporangium album]RCG27198.1 hypothetical protein DQ384_26120 [Sphaerisporangium album]